MDPFDEFEFKPLTEGLGFHNKKNAESPTIHTSQPILQSANQNLDIIESKPRIHASLPRANDRANENSAPTPRMNRPNGNNETVDEILKTLNQNKKIEFRRPDSFINESEATQEIVASGFDLSAALLDSMLLVAGFLLSLITMLVITKVDLFSNLLNPDEEGMVYLAMVGHFATITWIYLVVNRIFIGATPGEWVFDQMLGRPEKVGQSGYSLRVVIRSLLVIATGFITFPLLSMITGKDYLGKITGVELYKRP